jgi:hypothetical protein
VREVVLDPELLAAGVLGRPRPRRLLGLLAYGRWKQYAQLLGPAEAALIKEELAGNNFVLGSQTIDGLIEQARDQAARLNELLGYGAPDDLVLVASQRIVTAVVERVQIARQMEPVARADSTLEARARRIVQFLALGSSGHLSDGGLSTQSLRDHLVHVAAVSSAPLVSDDEDLAADDYTIYRHTDSQGGRPAMAVTTWTFVDEQIDCSPFTLDSVPYGLLDTAVQWI